MPRRRGLLQDRLLALLEFVEGVQPLRDRVQAVLGEVADRPAPIAREERGGRAFLEQRDGGSDVVGGTVEFGAETIDGGLGCHVVERRWA
jgi:hypothetical protein